MKLMLGLFHFNVQYVAGDLDCSHRICNEAIAPFLRALAGHSEWRLSMEIAGSGLDFLDTHYPPLIRLMRSLIEDGRLELISATYVPTVWVAFPREDLIRSVRLNRRCLERLGLPALRIFLAQEAFLGPGVRELGDFFDVALCKDDYLSHFVGASQVGPVYRLGDMKIIVGSNHLLGELSSDPRLRQWSFSEHRRQRLEKARASTLSTGASRGHYLDAEWAWYHFGSGHHLTTSTGPEDWEQFFEDSEWLRMTSDLLGNYSGSSVNAESRFRLGTVSDLAKVIADAEVPALEFVPEGSWNAKESEGVFAWMGRHVKPWQNSPALLGLVWRARTALVNCGKAAAALPAGPVREQTLAAIEEAWTTQLFAESSDSFGWAPLPREVGFVRTAAESVLRQAGQIRCQIDAAEIAPVFDSGQHLIPPEAAAAWAAFELEGGEGSVSCAQMREPLQIVDIHIMATSDVCGIRFPGIPDRITYCPSGLENEPVCFNPRDLSPAVICLPLANGLLGLSPGLYFIRDNCRGVVAARIQKSDGECIRFVVHGARKGQLFRWRFFLFKGSVEEAVEMANRLNSV